MDKQASLDLFASIHAAASPLPVSEAYELVGAAIGLLALGIERTHDVDRGTTFKMIQRHGHDTIKQMEQKK